MENNKKLINDIVTKVWSDLENGNNNRKIFSAKELDKIKQYDIVIAFPTIRKYPKEEYLGFSVQVRKEIGALICRKNLLTSLNYFPKIIKGNVDISYSKLETLEGCSEIIEGFLDCSHNNLKTLKGSPEIINGKYIIKANQLKTLKYCPKEVESDFDCSNNKLFNLKYRPKNQKYFICNNNPNLKNVKEEIIKHQIRAQRYFTDEGNFYFEDIEEEFEKETQKLLQNTVLTKKIILSKINSFELGI